MATGFDPLVFLIGVEKFRQQISWGVFWFLTRTYCVVFIKNCHMQLLNEVARYRWSCNVINTPPAADKSNKSKIFPWSSFYLPRQLTWCFTCRKRVLSLSCRLAGYGDSRKRPWEYEVLAHPIIFVRKLWSQSFPPLSQFHALGTERRKKTSRSWQKECGVWTWLR